MLSAAKHIILRFIDFFHKPFARFIPVQTFRYIACGGSNAVLGIILEYIAINFMLHRSYTHIIGLNIAPEVGAWVIANAVTLPAGFILSRYVVYPESNLHARIQVFRYALTTAAYIVLAYLLVKLFAYSAPSINPTVAYAFILIFISAVSYITQRLFTFKVTAEESL